MGIIKKCFPLVLTTFSMSEVIPTATTREAPVKEIIHLSLADHRRASALLGSMAQKFGILYQPHPEICQNIGLKNTTKILFYPNIKFNWSKHYSF